jgi:hypothetical protein
MMGTNMGTLRLGGDSQQFWTKLQEGGTQLFSALSACDALKGNREAL